MPARGVLFVEEADSLIAIAEKTLEVFEQIAGFDSEDYKKGFCDGFRKALEILRHELHAQRYRF